MSEKRNREHVVSVRVAPDELNRLQREADRRGVTISQLLRDEVVRDVVAPPDPDSSRRFPTAEALVIAQPGRLIDIRATLWNPGSEIAVGAAAARELAAALLSAATLAEQRNSTDEAWDEQHKAAS